jgi:hypothetical protein
MPCCRNSNEKPTAGVSASTAATPPEQVKADGDDEAAKAVHAEEKDERGAKKEVVAVSADLRGKAA